MLFQYHIDKWKKAKKTITMRAINKLVLSNSTFKNMVSAEIILYILHVHKESSTLITSPY